MMLLRIPLALGWQSCSCTEKDNALVCASPFCRPRVPLIASNFGHVPSSFLQTNPPELQGMQQG